MTHPTEYDPLAEGLFADNAALIAGGLEPERPTVGECHPGLALFYAGRLNEIHGEPGTGKSNLAAVATLTVLAQGKKVVCIDPEDTAISAIRRLVAFGCTVDAVIERERPALVILDGLAEALAAEGLSEDAPDDFLKFCRERLTPIANLGAAVLIADHVVKNTETRGRWSRGTGAKMGRYDGVSYSVALGKGYSPTQAGFVRLRVAKDRNGGVGVVGQEMAEIHFTPAGNNRTSVQFKEPANKDQQRFVPTAIMEKVSRRLELFPDSSLRDLRALGKADYVDTAIAELASLGHLEIARGGPGKPTRHRLINPYREHEEDEN
jgi:hypothetical protein